MPKEADFLDFPVEYTPVDSDIDIEKVKDLSKSLITGFLYIPAEISQSSQLNSVKLVDSVTFSEIAKQFNESTNLVNKVPKDNDKEDINPYGFYNPITRNAYVAVGNILRGKSKNKEVSYRLKHEMAHGFLFNYCGFFGSFSDYEFSRLNPDGFSYNETSIEAFPQVSSNKAAYSNVYEDSAYIIGDYIYKNYAIPYNALTNSAREKFILDLARLDQVIPGYAKYRIKLLSKVSTPDNFK